MSESSPQTALVFNLRFANINFPRVRKQSRMEKFDTFHEQKNSFSSLKRYFQGDSEARRTEIIKKMRDGFSGQQKLKFVPHFQRQYLTHGITPNSLHAI